MITTVFLDLYNTLAYFHPARESRLAGILKEFGADVGEPALCRGYLAADHYYTQAGMETPIHLLSHEDQEKVYDRYVRTVLEEVGLATLIPQLPAIRQRYHEVERWFALYPDVRPALDGLKEEGYKLGLITNVTGDPAADLKQVGLDVHFDSVTASCLCGYEKPDPRIFHAALESLGVQPHQTVHVGDQYLADIEGAQAVGIRAILIDRNGVQIGRHQETVRSLLELPPLLRNGRTG